MYMAKLLDAAFLYCKQFLYFAIRYNIWQKVFIVCPGCRELGMSIYDEATEKLK